MTARFNALADQKIAAALQSATCTFECADLDTNCRAKAVYQLDECAR